jgi:multidrug resistance efflux pump
MSPNYTLIAFQPSYADYCMSCLVGSWNEDFSIEVNLCEDELEEKWARALLDAHERSSPAEMQVTVLKNGWPMYSSDGDVHVETNWMYSQEYYDLEDKAQETGDYDALETAEARWNKELEDFQALRQRAEAKAKKLIEEKEAARKEKENKKQAKEEARKQALRKKKFEELKKEFE